MIMKKPSDLREIKTVTSIKEVNEANNAGDAVLIRKYTQNSQLFHKRLLLQSKQTGELVEVPSRNFIMQYGKAMSYPHKDWRLVFKVSSYSRTNPPCKDWGAYIVPKETQVGESVFISNLIEDLVACEFWSHKHAAENAIATWDGIDLIIDHNSYKRRLIG